MLDPFIRYSDEPYILSTQGEQVCYMKNEKKSDWCSVIRVQPRKLFAMPGTDKVGEINLDSVVVGVEDMNPEQQNEDVTTWSRFVLDVVSVDSCVIEQALATAMCEPDHNDLFDEDEDPDDTIAVGVVPSFITPGEDSDMIFLCVKICSRKKQEENVSLFAFISYFCRHFFRK